MRQLILKAARKLFLEEGFDKTSIRGIAEAIEYSPGTIYLYFKDKNDLVLALHNEAFDTLMKYFYPIMTIDDPLERLIEMGRKYLNYAIENPELYELMFLMKSPIETLNCKNEIWEHGHLATGMLKIILRNCIEADYFEEQDTEQLCLFVWSSVHGLATLHVTQRTSMYPEEERLNRVWSAYDKLVSVFRSGV